MNKVTDEFWDTVIYDVNKDGPPDPRLSELLIEAKDLTSDVEGWIEDFVDWMRANPSSTSVFIEQIRNVCNEYGLEALGANLNLITEALSRVK